MNSAVTSMRGYERPDELLPESINLGPIHAKIATDLPERIIRECLERPAAITGFPEVPDFSRETRGYALMVCS